MVEHWRRDRRPGPARSMAINGLGAICTAVTLVVVLVSKFAEGAWVTVLLIPVLLLLFPSVRAHYRDRRPRGAQRCPAGRRAPGAARSRSCPSAAGVPITRKALRIALKISPDVYALHIAGDEQAVLDLEDTWSQRVRQPSMDAGVAAPAAHRRSSPPSGSSTAR